LNSDLTCKVQSLTEQITKLESKIIDILESLKQINVPVSSERALLFDAVNEFSDHKSRKCNLMINGLKENPTLSTNADTSMFNELCNSMGVEAEISSITRLGKKSANNIRPLCVCLGNEANKWNILTRSPQLRHNPKWKHVYVNRDMTTAEREINRQLREELKERKRKGEVNLRIRKNKIVSFIH